VASTACRARARLGGLGASRGARKPQEEEEASRTFAFARTDGGMILSGPNDCRGSTKDARILPVFLHSPAQCVSQPSDVTAAGLAEPQWSFPTQPIAVRDSDLLLMDEGSGLLRLKPILKPRLCGEERVRWGKSARQVTAAVNVKGAVCRGGGELRGVMTECLWLSERALLPHCR
jgi:hypothetical protein